MPHKSEAQRRYFNSPAGKAKIGKEEVEHWNEVSKGKELPEKAVDKALSMCDSVDKKTVTNTISSMKQILTAINTKVGSMSSEAEINSAYKELMKAYECLRNVR